MEVSDSSRRILASLLEARTGQQLAMNRRWRIDTALAAIVRARGFASVDQLVARLVSGRDGLLGSRRLVDSGGVMLAQDRGSAAIWGMPRVVAEAGLACAVLPPADLARKVARRAGMAPPREEMSAWK